MRESNPPLRRERPPTTPQVQRGISPARDPKTKPAGGRFTPGRRVFRDWRVGSSARIQTKTAHPGFDREAQALRGDRGGKAGGRQAKVIARVPECHGGIVCKLFSLGWPAGCYAPRVVYAR